MNDLDFGGGSSLVVLLLKYALARKNNTSRVSAWGNESLW